MTWRPQFQNPRNINNVENPQPNQNNRPSTRGRFAPRGRGRGRGPPKLTNHNPKDPYFYCQYHGRGHSTERCPKTKKNIARIQQETAMMSIASSMPNQLRPSFWQPQFVNSQFIGARGVVSRKLPRYNCCEKTGGRVSTPTFRG
jgi:hypothetical protein